MVDSQNTVFISYRRAVGAFVARAVFQDLRANGYDVFLDVETINNGLFDTIILNQIAARAHFVVILIPGTVERCANSEDWLRREIEQAMNLKRNIIPLLVNGFTFEGTDSYLTGNLRELYRYNALNVTHDFFEEAMVRLRTRFLKTNTSIPITVASTEEQKVVEQKIAEVALLTESKKSESKIRYDSPSISSLEWLNQYNLDLFISWDDKNNVDDTFVNLELNQSKALSDNNHIQYAKQDINQAFADYSDSIRLYPQYAPAYYNRANLYVQNNDLHNAIDDYQTYLDVGGGKKYHNQSQIEEIIRNLKKRLK